MLINMERHVLATKLETYKISEVHFNDKFGLKAFLLAGVQPQVSPLSSNFVGLTELLGKA